MNVNKAILVGRVTREIELRNTNGGASVAAFSIATNEFWTDKSGQKQEKTEFHNIVLWGKLAEVAAQYLTKGQECYIEGRIQTRTYTAKDGTERRTTEIVGDTMQLGARPRGSHDSEYAPTAATARPAASQPAAPAATPEEPEIRIEDVPF